MFMSLDMVVLTYFAIAFCGVLSENLVVLHKCNSIYCNSCIGIGSDYLVPAVCVEMADDRHAPTRRKSTV
jgi:hypothetical protein